MEPALLNSTSDRYAFSVRRREGISTQTFAGSSSEAPIYNIAFKCPDAEAKDAILGALTSDLTRERRLLMRRLDRDETVVVGYAAVTKIVEIGAFGLSVDFDAGDSTWMSEVSTITRKSFASSRDHA